MKLYVNEKLFSLHDKLYVMDEEGNNLYEISSKVLSIGSKITVSDMAGNKVAYIEQELFHLLNHYKIYIGEELVCTIAKKFKLFKNNYELDNGYRIDGNFMALNFDIYEGEKKIAEIRRKFFSIGDKYEIDILEDDKKDFILAIIAVISKDINKDQNAAAVSSSNGSN